MGTGQVAFGGQTDSGASLTLITEAAKAAEEKYFQHAVYPDPTWHELPWECKMKLTIIELTANPSDRMVEAAVNAYITKWTEEDCTLSKAIGASCSAALMAAVKVGE